MVSSTLYIVYSWLSGSRKWTKRTETWGSVTSGSFCADVIDAGGPSSPFARPSVLVKTIHTAPNEHKAAGRSGGHEWGCTEDHVCFTEQWPSSSSNFDKACVLLWKKRIITSFEPDEAESMEVAQRK
jgi:hypothetical protein